MKPLAADIHKIRTHFYRYLKAVEAGHKVTVLRSGTTVAKIIPYGSAKTARAPGLLKNKVTIKPGFDDLPEGFEDFVE